MGYVLNTILVLMAIICWVPYVLLLDATDMIWQQRVDEINRSVVIDELRDELAAVNESRSSVVIDELRDELAAVNEKLLQRGCNWCIE